MDLYLKAGKKGGIFCKQNKKMIAQRICLKKCNESFNAAWLLQVNDMLQPVEHFFTSVVKESNISYWYQRGIMQAATGYLDT